MKARDWVQRFLLVLDSLAVLMVLVMVILTITDVSMRKFVDKPMTGVTEMVELALGVAFFFALPGVFWRSAHITMDIIDDRKARERGFDIIYEARDLELPQNVRDGLEQLRSDPVATKKRIAESVSRIDGDLTTFIGKAYWTD
jgi:hypothetical protein